MHIEAFDSKGGNNTIVFGSKELAVLYESYSTAAFWFCALQVKNTIIEWTVCAVWVIKHLVWGVAEDVVNDRDESDEVKGFLNQTLHTGQRFAYWTKVCLHAYI